MPPKKAARSRRITFASFSSRYNAAVSPESPPPIITAEFSNSTTGFLSLLRVAVRMASNSFSVPVPVKSLRREDLIALKSAVTERARRRIRKMIRKRACVDMMDSMLLARGVGRGVLAPSTKH